MQNRKLPTSKAYFGTFATSVFIQVCTVLQGILLARLLGPTGRGDFAAVILWPTLFAGIGIFGINMAIARFAGQGRSTAGLVRTAIIASLVTGFLSVILCGLALPGLLPADKRHLLSVAYVFLLFIPLNHLGMNLQGIDHGAGNFPWLNFTRAILYPVYFIGLVLCWLYATDKVFGAIVSLLVANCSVVMIRLIARWREFYKIADAPTGREVFSSSIPFVLASIITLLYMQMDKALLVWLLPSEEIGLYVAAFAAAGSVNVLNRALGVVHFSAASQAELGYGFEDLARLMRRGALLSFIGAGMLAVLFPWLVPLVYGTSFNAATSISWVLLPGLVLAGIGEIVNQSLRGQGQPIAGVVSKSGGIVVMGLLGWLLAERWGGKGIAFGYLTGELITFVGLIFVSIRYYKDANLKALRPDMEDIVFLQKRLIKRMSKSGL